MSLPRFTRKLLASQAAGGLYQDNIWQWTREAEHA